MSLCCSIIGLCTTPFLLVLFMAGGDGSSNVFEPEHGLCFGALITELSTSSNFLVSHADVVD